MDAGRNKGVEWSLTIRHGGTHKEETPAVEAGRVDGAGDNTNNTHPAQATDDTLTGKAQDISSQNLESHRALAPDLALARIVRLLALSELWNRRIT